MICLMIPSLEADFRRRLMSLPAVEKEEASKFFGPLQGRLSILLFKDNRSRALLGNFMLRCASAREESTSILDVDAFYCAQIKTLTTQIPQGFLEATRLTLLPSHGIHFEPRSLSFLLSAETHLLIIDSLNSLYSVASNSNHSRELMALMRLLSYNARMNGSKVVATAFGSEWLPSQDGSRRSLQSLGDLVIDVEPEKDGSVILRPKKSTGWLNGEFLVGNYFEV